MKIRKAKRKDLKEISRIYIEGAIDEVKLQFPKRSKKGVVNEMNKSEKQRMGAMRKGIDSENEYWIVCEEKQIMAGFGQAVIDKKNKLNGEMEKIYVDKKFRGKGIGLKISKELLKWLKKKGVQEVINRVYFKNKPSIKLQEKLGFEIVGVGMHKNLK